MGKFDGIYLVSDLDGTLLDNKDYGISEENRDAINGFMAEGGRFGFATGRTVKELFDFNRIVETNAPSITCNGMEIHDFSTGKNIIRDEIREDILPFLKYIEDEYPGMMIDIISDSDIYYFRPNSSLEIHKHLTTASFHEVSHYSLVPHPWMKIAIWDGAEEIEALAGGVDLSKLAKGYNFMYSFKYCCEISTFNADKGNALLEARDMIEGIKKVVAVGDNGNDILMLKNADLSFVPSNAVDLAKQNADIVLECDCNHSAVARVIKMLEEMV